MNKCKTKKSVRRRNKKNIAGQVLTYNSKNFNWLNKKVDIERTMSELGKPFFLKSGKKTNTENQCQNADSENKKPLARNVNLILTKKLGLEWTMNGSGKKSDPKNRKKNSKIKAELPHVNKKPLARKRIFVQTPFSHSTLKLEPKKSRRKTTRVFFPFPVLAWPKWLLQFDFKNHENVSWNRSLKKDSAPLQFKLFEL